MKVIKLLFMSLIFFSGIIFYSCHTETPVNVDHESPEVSITMIYNDTDTLFNSLDSSEVFTDFDHKIDEENGDHTIVVDVEDNGTLYDIKLYAKDALTNDMYLIESKHIESDGQVVFIVKLDDFPVVQDINPQRFYLTVKVSDDYENTNSVQVGFEVGKLFIQEKLYNEFGMLIEVAGDSIDFREKVGELTFIQFLAAG